jgi:hypothetical protein
MRSRAISAEERDAALDALRALGTNWRAQFITSDEEEIMGKPPHIEAAALFTHLLPEVERFDRERRMQRTDVTPEEIRRASDMDLATRLRMKRGGKLS